MDEGQMAQHHDGTKSPSESQPLSQAKSPTKSPSKSSILPEFVVRLVSIDYYMARPTPGLDECYSRLEGKTIDQVPIIRIFGSTPSGQKACVHVHGVSGLLFVVRRRTKLEAMTSFLPAAKYICLQMSSYLRTLHFLCNIHPSYQALFKWALAYRRMPLYPPLKVCTLSTKRVVSAFVLSSL